jgi:hypothetical protein
VAAPHNSSIISAKLTTAGLSVKRIQKLGDMTGTLCVESAYPVAMQFVRRVRANTRFNSPAHSAC